MSDTKRTETIAPDLGEEVEKLLRTNTLTEEQKVSALRKLLEILDDHTKKVVQ